MWASGWTGFHWLKPDSLTFNDVPSGRSFTDGWIRWERIKPTSWIVPLSEEKGKWVAKPFWAGGLNKCHHSVGTLCLQTAAGRGETLASEPGIVAHPQGCDQAGKVFNCTCLQGGEHLHITDLTWDELRCLPCTLYPVSTQRRGTREAVKASCGHSSVLSCSCPGARSQCIRSWKLCMVYEPMQSMLEWPA
jgi:hypothetical protein